ncbi:MAG: 8-amino-7-oxononanoate synthase [Rickettsiales bacterium]|nr:8-amino-7-oxononanoate synthase [Rickettsiales bacterium]
MKNFYFDAVKNIKEKNLYRQLVESDVISAAEIKRGKQKYISFCSNDYFALSQNKLVKKAAIEAIKKYGAGAGASRYVTGNNSLYTKLEKQISSMKNADEAIVFSSGYASAIGVIPALVDEGDLIVADRLIHSSLIDGAKLSNAKLIRFLHNDISHAKKILAENRSKFKKCLIITETVFSMDGDVSEVEELLKLANEFDAILISDDAHGLFLNGENQGRNKCRTGSETQSSHSCKVTTEGEDWVSDPVLYKILKQVQDDGVVGSYLQLGTFSKAVGSLGGYVAGDKVLIDYLRNFAKSQIYSTALPPAVLAASLASLKIIAKKNLGKKALENATYFCELMNLPKPESAIVPIIIGDNKKTLDIASKVKEKGFLISAIRPPTVEAGKARLRITFSSEHKKQQIKKLVKILTKIGVLNVSW